MNSLIEARQSPSLLINYFHDAAFSILAFALAARPPLFALIVELIHLKLAIVVTMLFFLHSKCLGAIWFRRKLRIFLERSIVQFGLNNPSHYTVYCFL